MPRLLNYQFSHAFAHDDIALRDTKPLTRTLISSAHHVEFAGAAVWRMGKGHAALQWLVQAGARTCLSATSACGRFAGDIQIVSAIRWPNQLYSEPRLRGTNRSQRSDAPALVAANIRNLRAGIALNGIAHNSPTEGRHPTRHSPVEATSMIAARLPLPLNTTPRGCSHCNRAAKRRRHRGQPFRSFTRRRPAPATTET